LADNCFMPRRELKNGGQVAKSNDPRDIKHWEWARQIGLLPK